MIRLTNIPLFVVNASYSESEKINVTEVAFYYIMTVLLVLALHGRLSIGMPCHE